MVMRKSWEEELILTKAVSLNKVEDKDNGDHTKYCPGTRIRKK